MRIVVKSNIKEYTKDLRGIAKKQVPFAASVALNKTAEFAATNLNNDTRKYLDRPTLFTQRAFSFKRSTKRNLEAEVFAKRVQEQYLRFAVYGGTRRPRGRAIVLPVKGTKLNKYGNIPRGRVRRLLSRPDTFSGTVFGIPGIWQRGHYTRGGRFSTAGSSRASNLRLLYAYESKAQYKPRLPYARLVKGYVDKALEPFFRTALRNALRTAR